MLFSTDHCSLCEEALDLLFSMTELQGLSVRVVDVALDDALAARYGERLPVLEVAGGAGTVVLSWPFDARQILAALR